MEIQRIAHQDIDKVKWNSCVHYATNGNVFGYKWYLDTIAKEWDALVEGDYESILPLFLTEHSDTLEQPRLLREAGIYSIHMLSQSRVEAFLKAIPAEYTNLRIQLNEGVPVSESVDFEVSEVDNHQLILLDPYERIAERYAPETRIKLKSENIKKLLPSSNVKPENIAQLFKENNVNTNSNDIAFHSYQRIMYNALHRGWGATFGVTDLDKNLLSAGFFIYAQGRMMQLVAATSPKGNELGAYEYLMDNIMQSHAGRPLVLDFNTSDEMPRLFGATVNQFLQLKKGKIIEKEEPIIKKKSWRFW